MLRIDGELSFAGRHPHGTTGLLQAQVNSPRIDCLAVVNGPSTGQRRMAFIHDRGAMSLLWAGLSGNQLGMSRRGLWVASVVCID